MGAGTGGGGFFLSGGDATLTNSSVTGNRSAAGAGGIEIYVGDWNVIITVANTLLADNSGLAGNLGAEIDVSGSVTVDANHSLFGDDPAEINGTDIGYVFTDTPGVGPLADNGCSVPAGAPGSATCVQTHALPTSSPAIDAADDTVCANEPVNDLDQRGQMRPADGDMDGFANCDIGAFERQAAATPIDYDITGSWYDPTRDGQGFSFEVIPERDVIVVYWFTYTVDGPAQMWLQGSGTITGDTAKVELARPIGGQFDDDSEPTRPVWGTMTIGFDSATGGTVSYDSPLDEVSGTFPIQRTTPQAFCE
jgi:hypothetical protein